MKLSNQLVIDTENLFEYNRFAMAGIEQKPNHTAAQSSEASYPTRMQIVSEINEGTKNLADSIRQYSRQQVDLWRQVPSLFLEKEGKHGYSDNRDWICKERAFPIRYLSGLFIDLNNGEIVHFPGFLNPIMVEDGEIDLNEGRDIKAEPVPDEYVLSLASSLNKIDAAWWVEFLLKEAQAPYSSYVNSQQEVEQWREKERERTGLEKPNFEEIRRVLDDYKKKNGIEGFNEWQY